MGFLSLQTLVDTWQCFQNKLSLYQRLCGELMSGSSLKSWRWSGYPFTKGKLALNSQVNGSILGCSLDYVYYNVQARGSIGHPIWSNSMVHLSHQWHFGTLTTLPSPATPPSSLTATAKVILPLIQYTYVWNHCYMYLACYRTTG